MTKLPRLLDRDLNFVKTLYPMSASIALTITPLSTASLQLPEDETIPERYFVEMFIPSGSAGIYRVCAPQNSYGDDVSETELEHAVVEVGDYLVRAKYTEMMPAGKAVKTIFSHYRGGRWKLGDTSVLGSKSIAVSANYETVLQALNLLMDQLPDYFMTFDFSTTPWTLGFARKGSEVTAEGRLSRNVQSAKITYDDSELCTRAYYEQDSVSSDGGASSVWKSVDADTIGRYGVVEREVLTGSDYTQAEIEYTVSEYLRKHKEPKISVEIDADDLSQITGEPLDSFQIGKMFRLALPDYDMTVENVITMLAYDDVYGEPNHAVIYLGQEEDSAVTYIHEISNGSATGASSGGGGGGLRKKNDDKFKEYQTRFQQTDLFMDLAALHMKDNDSILEQAGLYLDSNGVLMYADENEYGDDGYIKNTIMGRVNVKSREVTAYVEDTAGKLRGEIKVERNRVSLLVDDKTGKIKPASIVASINDAGSEVLISADHIKLDGKTTVGGVLSVSGHDLIVGRNIHTNLSGGYVQTTSVRLVGGSSSQGANVITLSAGNMARAVKDVKVSGNTLKLTLFNGDVVNFKKAATLTGKWSSGVFTVEASTGEKLTTSLTVGAASRSGNTIRIPVKATVGGSATLYDAITAETTLGAVCSSMSITRAIAYRNASGTDMYYGRLYYYDANSGSYKQAASSDQYWYYSSTNRTGTSSVFY